jgi:DNA polymerase-4/protein ImuB
VWQVTRSARRAGVTAGTTVSQAIGLCPQLVLIEPDPVYYDEQFTRLVAALGNVSPVVEPAELGRVFIGVDGLEKLVGPPARQLTVIRHALEDAAKGWSGIARVGWGRGKFVAWVAAARAKPGRYLIVHDHERSAFLSQQPSAVLPVLPDTHRRLVRLGFETLGDIGRLPEVAMVSQFGREGYEAWQRATGRYNDPVVGVEHPEPIIAALHFSVPIADRRMVVKAMHTLITRALEHPRRIGWRVQATRVRARLEHGASWLTEVIHKDPSAHSEHILAPLEVRLEQFPPTGGIEHLSVEFTDFARGTQELQFFARDAASAMRAGRRDALRQAAAEISNRLKRPMLHHIIEVQPWSRIPERRYALIDFEH